MDTFPVIVVGFVAVCFALVVLSWIAIVVGLSTGRLRPARRRRGGSSGWYGGGGDGGSGGGGGGGDGGGGSC